MARPTASAGAPIVGPRTAPSVPTHTTVLMARARCSGSARSAAAYLAWRLADWPPPNRSIPTTKRGSIRS